MGSVDIYRAGDDNFGIEFQPKQEAGSTHGGKEVDTSKETTSSQNAQDPPRLQSVQLIVLLSCLFLGNFTIGFDSSCIGTLLVILTDHFDALQDIGWYQTTYLLTLCAPILIIGRLYTIYSMKTLYVLSLTIFIAGSILTAASPTSTAFILGRAVSGLGAAGINSGMYIILAHTVPLQIQPSIFGICGAVECTALAFGPLISGSIAHADNWRINFWTIVGLGSAVALGVSVSVGHLRQNVDDRQLSVARRLKSLDWYGLATELPMTICLILGLQWAGTTYSWSNWRIILLLTVTGLLAILFFVVEHIGGSNSMIPLPILRQRNVALSCVVGFCNFAALWIFANYIPIYFQVVRGANTLHSALMYLPTTVSMSICALASGHFTSIIGYFNPALLFGSALSVAGAALMATFKPDTPAGRWIAYQIIYGIGVGMAFQPPFIALQTVLERPLVPAALVLLNFVQMLGGIIFLSIAQNMFLDKLANDLAQNIPNFDPAIAKQNGATGLEGLVPVAYRPQVILAYNSAITEVFYIALGLVSVGLLAALGLQWRSIKKDDEKKG
ncbi:efflux pump antibiotic resistance protein [Penicillium nucicola]|uniref:efflux pump antibiotic resistance protein n=1 Tax=Penicillium nucicola TaxID=1850975 RepID=UPI0025451A0E|nr:efflux pump antibiotic resistance protein [Penicillium nucicola]KAJ5775632.1 efflux pump antibiotic resistance protein [Penicillium nucicola]